MDTTTTGATAAGNAALAARPSGSRSAAVSLPFPAWIAASVTVSSPSPSVARFRLIYGIELLLGEFLFISMRVLRIMAAAAGSASF